MKPNYNDELEVARDKIDPELMPYVEKIFETQMIKYEKDLANARVEITDKPEITLAVISEANRLRTIAQYMQVPKTNEEEGKIHFPLPERRNKLTKSPLVEGIDGAYLRSLDVLIPQSDLQVIKRFRRERNLWDTEGVRVKHLQHAYKAANYAYKYGNIENHNRNLLQAFVQNLESIIDNE